MDNADVRKSLRFQERSEQARAYCSDNSNSDLTHLIAGARGKGAAPQKYGPSTFKKVDQRLASSFVDDDKQDPYNGGLEDESQGQQDADGPRKKTVFYALSMQRKQEGKGNEMSLQDRDDSKDAEQSQALS